MRGLIGAMGDSTASRIAKAARREARMGAAGMAPHRSGTVHIVRLNTDQATAARVMDAVAEALDSRDAIAAAYEHAGRWAVEIVFALPPNRQALRDLIVLVAGPRIARRLEFATAHTRDWAAATPEALAPVIAGRYRIHGAHARESARANQIAIEIEAALAFGTGHHGTTRGCLLALDRLVRERRPARILDVGTGSGVLAIAAARTLRRRVLASDIDRRAVVTARENARLNRSGSLVTAIHAAGLGDRRLRERGPYDLVFANILLGTLRELATPLTRLIAPGGCVLLSGLLPGQATAAMAAYRARGLALVRRIPLDGWVTLVMTRPLRPPRR